MHPTLNYSYPPSSTGLSLPLWPNFILTQFLTNHGSFHSYLHKTNKTPTPTCSCLEKAAQTAHHLTTERSLFSSEHPTVLFNIQQYYSTSNSTSNPSPTSGSEVSHKYRQSHKLPQKHLPHTSRANERQLNSVTTPKQHAD
jgi:hypothetical protein